MNAERLGSAAVDWRRRVGWLGLSCSMAALVAGAQALALPLAAVWLPAAAENLH